MIDDLKLFVFNNTLNVNGELCNRKISKNYDKLLEYFNTIKTNLSLLGVLRCIVYNNATLNCKCGGELVDTYIKNKNFHCKKCSKIKRNKSLKSNNMEKYGVENVFQLNKIKEKITETNLSKYGVKYPTQSETIKSKIIKNNKEKYGKEVFRGSDEYYISIMGEERFEKFKNLDVLYDIYANECENNLILLSNKFCMSNSAMSKYFKKNDLPIIYSYNTSQYEIDLFTELSNVYSGEIIRNSRDIIGPYELDLYFPDKSIAVEISGAYWHSEKFKFDKKYHANKYEMCVDKNIQLLTFWDLEYSTRKKQILQFIKSKLGVFERRLFARNVEFKEIDIKQYSFFEENHIQGKPSAIDRNFGLFLNDELVACVSFAKHHRNSSKYTLNRLAFKNDIQVVGGTSKLIRNSLKIIGGEVITWSDNRFSSGCIYKNNFFEFDGDLPIDYCYFDNKTNSIMSKQSNKKKNIGCPTDITEHEFCKSIGRFRIWDCGKKRWVYRNNGLTLH